MGGGGGTCVLGVPAHPAPASGLRSASGDWDLGASGVWGGSLPHSLCMLGGGLC